MLLGHRIADTKSSDGVVAAADAGLKPGDKVSLAHIAPGWAQAAGGLVSVGREHVVGQEGAGLYSVVLGVTLKPSSYAVLVITH